MESSPPRDTPDDPKASFVRSLPRKIVEIKAAFGALIADSRTLRVRDELRRKLHALYSLASSYQLQRLSDSVRATVDILDATRANPSLTRANIDALATQIAAFSHRADEDQQADAPASPSAPSGTRDEPSRAAAVRAAPTTGALRSIKSTLADFRALPEPSSVDAVIPAAKHTLPPGTTLRKGPVALAGHGASIHVLFVGTSARATALHEALPVEVELLVTRSALDAVQRAKESAPDVIVAEVTMPADGVALVSALRADPVTEFFPTLLIGSEVESIESLRERCPDAAEVLPHAIDGAALWDALERLLGGGLAPYASRTHDFGDVTLDELSRALQDEIRRGIVSAASPRARGARIPLGAGNDVLVATWEAIARIREVVERRSNGAVRFELPTAPRGLPGTQLVTLGSDDGAQVQDHREDPLPGRSVLVVDDDKAVVANFAGLLRDAGATVTECTDGKQALDAARRIRPDLVIADIVMPGIDGFGLCQAIRRDPALRHTPIVLISWRDDLLVRMRELGAQAQGYLRKEAGGESILARVRDALRQRVRLLRRIADLTGTSEVRGRIERVGVIPLIETAASALVDATVTVADPWSLTELHVREGKLVAALRTAHDGSLLRGEGALIPVLGASTARFSVSRSKAPVRENLTGSIIDTLIGSARRLVALEDSLAGSALLEVTRVELDREAAMAYSRTLPPRLAAVVERVAAGETPRDLVLRDAMAPSDLEPLLVELVRRGAIHRVFGARDEDLAALRMTQSTAPPPRSQTPAPIPSGQRSATQTSDQDNIASLADVVWRELQGGAADEPLRRRNSPGPHPAAKTQRRPTPAEPAKERPPEDLPLIEFDSVVPAVPKPPAVKTPAPRAPAGRTPVAPRAPAVKTPATPVPARLIAASIPGASTVDPIVSPDRAATRKVTTIPPLTVDREPTRKLPSVVDEAVRRERAQVADAGMSKGSAAPDDELPDNAGELLTGFASATRSSEALTSRVPKASPPRAPGVASSEVPSTQRAPTPPPTPPPQALHGRSSVRTKQDSDASSSSLNKPPPLPAASKRATLKMPPPNEPVRRESSPTRRTDPSRPPKPSSKSLGWLLPLGVAFAFAGSYYGMRWFLSERLSPDAPSMEQADAEPTLNQEGDAADPLAPSAQAPLEAPSDVGPAPAPIVAPTPAPAPTSPSAAEEPSLEPFPTEYAPAAQWYDGGALAVGQGVVVLVAADGAQVSARIDQSDASSGARSIAASEGMHAVRIQSGDRVRYQLASVRAGQALVIRVPTSW